MGKKNKDKKTGITASDGTNTDGRKKYDWDTKYNDASRQKMFHESIYIGAVFVISLIVNPFNILCLRVIVWFA